MQTKKQAKITSASSAKISPTSAPRSHASKDVLIDIDNIGVKFGAETALQGVSLCVHRGEFVGLIGPNGAGKTTLLKAMLGLQEVTTGRIARPLASIGYVPQRGRLYNATVPISVMEVVRLAANGSRPVALQALQAVYMQHAAGRRFSELSGGQQQRVAIAKALAGNADVLILDEPTTGIDERSQAEFYDLLQTLQARGITIVIVSHEIDTVLALVTRVICLNRTVLYDGPPQQFEADKHLPSYYKAQHIQLHHHHGGDHA